MKVRELIDQLRKVNPALDVAVHLDESDQRTGSYSLRRLSVRGGAVQIDEIGERVFSSDEDAPGSVRCCWVELEA